MNQNWNITASHNVLELIAIFKIRIKGARGIELHTEVEIIGEEI